MSRTKRFAVYCKGRLITYDRVTDRFLVSGTTATFYSRAAAQEWIYQQHTSGGAADRGACYAVMTRSDTSR